MCTLAPCRLTPWATSLSPTDVPSASSNPSCSCQAALLYVVHAQVGSGSAVQRLAWSSAGHLASASHRDIWSLKETKRSLRNAHRWWAARVTVNRIPPWNYSIMSSLQDEAIVQLFFLLFWAHFAFFNFHLTPWLVAVWGCKRHFADGPCFMRIVTHGNAIEIHPVVQDYLHSMLKPPQVPAEVFSFSLACWQLLQNFHLFLQREDLPGALSFIIARMGLRYTTK